MDPELNNEIRQMLTNTIITNPNTNNVITNTNDQITTNNVITNTNDQITTNNVIKKFCVRFVHLPFFYRI